MDLIHGAGQQQHGTERVVGWVQSSGFTRGRGMVGVLFTCVRGDGLDGLAEAGILGWGCRVVMGWVGNFQNLVGGQGG